MSRWLTLVFGLISYLCFLTVFAAMAAFVGGFLLPRTVDGPPGSPPFVALAVNVALVAMFGLQHSVMARPRFKAWWTRWISAPAERSVYVMASNVAMVVLMLLWRPFGGAIWHVEAPALRSALWVLFGLGWLAVPLASLAIDHLELFGVKQVWRHFRGRPAPTTPLRTPAVYRMVRHPLYVGWLMAFWVTPTMTVSHLLFSAAMTGYILIAIRFEERDLLAEHGRPYAEWRASTPMLIPRLPSSPNDTVAGEAVGERVPSHDGVSS